MIHLKSYICLGGTQKIDFTGFIYVFFKNLFLRGRPKKQPRVRPNSGRRRMFDMDTASRTTKYLLAKKIIAMVDNSEKFLEYTLNLCRNLNKKLTEVPFYVFLAILNSLYFDDIASAYKKYFLMQIVKVNINFYKGFNLCIKKVKKK